MGIATTASAFALLAPSFVTDISRHYNFNFPQETFLFCPLIAVLAASIAGLASSESASQCAAAAGVGNRRFASSKAVGQTWLSATEQVEMSAVRLSKKWFSFSYAVFVAPIVACLFPGALSFKGIVCAAVASAQAAYYLANAGIALLYSYHSS